MGLGRLGTIQVYIWEKVYQFPNIQLVFILKPPAVICWNRNNKNNDRNILDNKGIFTCPKFWPISSVLTNRKRIQKIRKATESDLPVRR